jgi:hypothetical protein
VTRILSNIARPAPEPQMPTVNVTIGRLEVRATPEPVSPRRRAAATAPAMKLEEYLRGRSAGGGR